ncbi:hypothetical protein C8J57DRAFT_1594485 [Mycena rebaudengoi]|nr:hypothetical protein C8J57DRAFT_1594485 [Mycena rebaudengoi]
MILHQHSFSSTGIAKTTGQDDRANSAPLQAAEPIIYSQSARAWATRPTPCRGISQRNAPTTSSLDAHISARADKIHTPMHALTRFPIPDDGLPLDNADTHGIGPAGRRSSTARHSRGNAVVAPYPSCGRTSTRPCTTLRRRRGRRWMTGKKKQNNKWEVRTHHYSFVLMGIFRPRRIGGSREEGSAYAKDEMKSGGEKRKKSETTMEHAADGPAAVRSLCHPQNGAESVATRRCSDVGRRAPQSGNTRTSGGRRDRGRMTEA